MQSIEDIEVRLLKTGCPPELIAKHVTKVAKWRKDHPRRIKRKRSYEFVLNAQGHVVRYAKPITTIRNKRKKQKRRQWRDLSNQNAFDAF